MSFLPRLLSKLIILITIASLAGLTALGLSAILHRHSDLLFGLIFVASFFGLLSWAIKSFPKIYSDLHPRPWWQNRGVAAIAFGIVISIFSSRIATIWFGLVALSGMLIALFLHIVHKNDEL